MPKPPGRPVSPAKQALLTLLRTADRVKGRLAATIEAHGITAQQFNVLRILRGAEPEGLPTLTVATRMVERAPGITRMLDRLERQGLVGRERRAGDRRCVHVRISRKGLELLEGLDRPVDAADRAAFSALDARELAHLTALLEKVRQAHERG